MDLLLVNGRVRTMESAQPEAAAVWIRDGQIFMLAPTRAAWEAWLFQCPASAIVINCRECLVLPGFHDAHLHLMATAAQYAGVDVSPGQADDLASLIAQVGRATGSRRPGDWIRAYGYDETALREGRHPTRWDLDTVSPQHPVKVVHRSGHAWVLNTMALAAIGLLHGLAPGFKADRDPETGELTGLFWHAESVLGQLIPHISAAELAAGARQLNQLFLRNGITSVQDATPADPVTVWPVLARWIEDDLMKPRISTMMSPAALDRLGPKISQFERKPGASLRLAAVKLMPDDANLDMVQLTADVERATRAGWQVACHAIELGTSLAFASALTAARSKGLDLIRPRVEHGAICPLEIAAELSLLGAVVVTQPAFLHWFGSRYRRTVSDPLDWLYPTALQDQYLPVAFSSDAPVTLPNPFLGMAAAQTRHPFDSTSALPGATVSARTALRMSTRNGAYASGQESCLGQIRPGFCGDVIVVDTDLLTASPAMLQGTQVLLTVVGGRIVWDRGLL